MKVGLHYGSGILSLEIPQSNIAEIIRPWQHEKPVDNTAILQRALTEQQTQNFQERIEGKCLCVLVDDGTRDEPFGDIFGQVFGILRPSRHVRFLICTGTHEPDTPENGTIKGQVKEAAKKVGIEHFSMHAHDCEREGLRTAGRTSHGTEILFNALADDADLFLVLSDIKVHYFAGYSNPVKNFVPGICGYETAEQNHSLALDERSTFGVHPWHKNSDRRDNPLAEDQLEVMHMIVRDRPVYALVTISTSARISWAGFGPVDEVSGEAFSVVDDRNTHTVKPVSRLVVSPGGLPNDTSLYIAQRALELTKNAVVNGGEILFLASCPAGIGEARTIENFYNRLTAPVGDILKSIESGYRLYNHKPYKFAQLILRLRRIWMHSDMPDNVVEAAHLYPIGRPQTIIDNWLAEEPDVRITVVDGANKIALYAQA